MSTDDLNHYDTHYIYRHRHTSKEEKHKFMRKRGEFNKARISRELKFIHFPCIYTLLDKNKLISKSAKSYIEINRFAKHMVSIIQFIFALCS